MKFRSYKSVESYETAITISNDKKEELKKKAKLSPQDNFSNFFADYATVERIDVTKYFSPQNIEILKKLHINVRTHKIHTYLEVLAIRADLMLYKPQPPKKIADLPLPSNVSQKEFNTVLQISEKMFIDII